MKITLKRDKKELQVRIQQSSLTLSAGTALGGWESRIYQDADKNYFSVVEDTNTSREWSSELESSFVVDVIKQADEYNYGDAQRASVMLDALSE